MQPSFDRAAMPYWDRRAATWNIAPPLAPHADDIAFYEACAERTAAGAQSLRALLLGVTAPIAAMRWPASTRLFAVDWSEGMLRHVWPRDRVPAGARAIRGDWREIPLRDASLDLAVGDGCYSAFRDLQGPHDLNREVRRVLRPGGLFCLRCFRRPDHPPPVPALFEALFSGSIANLDLFRWLLAMSLQEDRGGVRLDRVWRAWHERVPDATAHRERLAWSDAAIANIEGWRGQEACYYFPDLAAIHALAAPFFAVESCDFPHYEWGERFPRLVMRRID